MVPSMKPSSLFFAALLIVPQLQGQDDTAHHRAVYQDINDKAADSKPVKATHKDDPLVFELQGWFEGKVLRKIISIVPGEDGDGSEEYYLENGQPLFVFRRYSDINQDTGKVLARHEDRFYFKDGKMFKWLDTAKKPMPPTSEDFIAEAERLTSNTRSFIAAFGGKGIIAKPQAVQTTTGTFLGIEEGDYAHWQMKDESGKEVSFFILRPEASVEKVLKNPKAYRGKKCHIQWKASTEKIPEAGGDMKVEQILSVEWIK
ncbi:MAG: hypothetical protein RL693_1215 [Verrucomicrobiota bacterium]